MNRLALFHIPDGLRGWRHYSILWSLRDREGAPVGIFNGLFVGKKERERLDGLRQLEDKRLVFAKEVNGMSIRLEQSCLCRAAAALSGWAYRAETYSCSRACARRPTG